MGGGKEGRGSSRRWIEQVGGRGGRRAGRGGSRRWIEQVGGRRAWGAAAGTAEAELAVTPRGYSRYRLDIAVAGSM